MKKIIFLSLILIFVTSCQTYFNENQKMRDSLYAGNIENAIKNLDSSGINTQERNYALYNMEKGMLFYLNKNYNEAIKSWQHADRKLDDLYTTSISKTAASFVINDSFSDYTGEIHERILIPIFSALSFYSENNLQNALVMVRRTYDLTKSLDDGSTNSQIMSKDIFTHYLSGMIYEAKGDYDNAIVEYKKALENSEIQNELVAEKEIIKTLGRLSEYKDRSDILRNIKKIDPKITWLGQKNYQKNAEVYIIYESGRSPVKKPTEIIVPVLDTIVRVSFPSYETVAYSNHYCDIYLNDANVGRTILMANVGKMAKAALEDRRLKDTIKMTARLTAKTIAARKLAKENPWAGLAANVFNVATEVADTRSWTSLPDTIQIARLLVKADKEETIQIKPESAPAFSFKVNLKPGEKFLYRFRTYD